MINLKHKVKSLTGYELNEMKEDHPKHLEKANMLKQQIKNNIKSAKKFWYRDITFDLQKTYPLPKLPTGIVYYKRQLNFHNLRIHVGSSGKGIFNVWIENEARRGTEGPKKWNLVWEIKYYKK